MATAAANYDFELRDEHVRVEGDNLLVSGYASNFDVDRVGDQVTRAALDRALTEYMRNPIVLYDHRYTQPAGIVTNARVGTNGLWIAARLPKPENGLPRHYWNMVKAGVMKALSIGGVWKREVVGGIKRLVEIDLREISIASVGVNGSTLLSTQMAKAFNDESPRLTRLRYEHAQLVEASRTADLIGMRLAVAAARPR